MFELNSKKFSTRRLLQSGLMACCLWGGAATAFADDGLSPFSVQGFGTLGVARTDTNDEEFVRDLSQQRGVTKNWSPKIDSVLGVQANWRMAPAFEAVVQAISRYRYDASFTPEIPWAYVKYDPTPAVSMRAGRLGTEFFMQADSRWVGYSFLTVRPVGDYFWYLPFYSIRGGDAAYTWSSGDSVVRGKVFYGHSDGKIPLSDRQWDIAGSPMMGALVEFQDGAWHLRASYANIHFKRDLPTADVVYDETKKNWGFGYSMTGQELDFLKAKDTRSDYYALGAIYDRGPWLAQLMLNHVVQGSNSFESSDGGYALVGYRVGEVTPFLGYSWIRSKIRGGAPTMIAQSVMQDAHADQKTGIVGARWDFAHNVALKAQWDAIRGNSTSLFPYRMDNRERWDGKMNVFSMTLDFVF